MLKKVARVLLIFHTIVEIKSGPNSLLTKLVNDKHSSNNQSIEKKCLITEANNPGIEFACRYKRPSVKGPVTRLTGHAKARFIDFGDNDTAENDEMEAPTGKLSILNLFPDNEHKEESDFDDDNDDDQVKMEEEEEGGEEEKEEEDYGISFFDEEDLDLDKLNGTKSESLLKQYHRQSLRMHHLVFPLLLAYKLKFFTVIPLLLGSLVLLVGTTGVAGFFFALFAAALGIRAKSQH